MSPTPLFDEIPKPGQQRVEAFGLWQGPPRLRSSRPCALRRMSINPLAVLRDGFDASLHCAPASRPCPMPTGRKAV